MIKEVPTTTNPGIYALVNLENGKSYIGKTKNIHRRIQQHLNELEQGKHQVEKLQADYNLGNVFKITILNEYPDNVEDIYLYYEEGKYIALYESHKIEHGYNTVGPLNTFSPAEIARAEQAKDMQKILENVEKRLQKTKEDINQYLHSRPIDEEKIENKPSWQR